MASCPYDPQISTVWVSGNVYFNNVYFAFSGRFQMSWRSRSFIERIIYVVCFNSVHCEAHSEDLNVGKSCERCSYAKISMIFFVLNPGCSCVLLCHVTLTLNYFKLNRIEVNVRKCKPAQWWSNNTVVTEFAIKSIVLKHSFSRWKWVMFPNHISISCINIYKLLCPPGRFESHREWAICPHKIDCIKKSTWAGENGCIYHFANGLMCPCNDIIYMILTL